MARKVDLNFDRTPSVGADPRMIAPGPDGNFLGGIDGEQPRPPPVVHPREALMKASGPQPVNRLNFDK